MKTRYTLVPSILSLSLLATLPTLAQQQEPAKSKTDTTVRRTYVIKEVNVKDKKREKKVQKKEIGREVVSDRDISRQFILSTKDFVRYMPGVGISESVSRYGNKGFAIRGVDENRVSISSMAYHRPRRRRTSSSAPMDSSTQPAHSLRPSSLRRWRSRRELPPSSTALVLSEAQ